jgi:HEPN domain-containing protein
MSRDEIIKYWQESSEVDFQAMETLFKNGHFVWALFLGHLVVEKLLKAYYVRKVDIDSPQIHNLLKIAEKAQLELSDDQKMFLDEVTTFNIQARYPDFKNRFYRKATRDFAEKYLLKIREFKEWLLKQINK